MSAIASAMWRKCSKNLLARSSYTLLCRASSSAIRSMFSENIAIHAVPSAWLMNPPVGSGLLRSNTPMLSSPRNPPWNRFRPSASLRFTHHVKFSSSLWKTRSRNTMSPPSPRRLRSIWNTRQVAQAWTGGFTSEKFHS